MSLWASPTYASVSCRRASARALSGTDSSRAKAERLAGGGSDADAHRACSRESPQRASAAASSCAAAPCAAAPCAAAASSRSARAVAMSSSSARVVGAEARQTSCSSSSSSSPAASPAASPPPSLDVPHPHNQRALVPRSRAEEIPQSSQRAQCSAQARRSRAPRPSSASPRPPPSPSAFPSPLPAATPRAAPLERRPHAHDREAKPEHGDEARGEQLQLLGPREPAVGRAPLAEQPGPHERGQRVHDGG